MAEGFLNKRRTDARTCHANNTFQSCAVNNIEDR